MIPRSLLALCVIGTLGPIDEWSEYATLSRDVDPDKRCQAIDKIKRHKDLKMAQALLALLGDAHPRVRHRAMTAIRTSTDAAIPRFLSEKGLKHGNRHVRQCALQALSSLEDPSTTAAIIERLGDSEPEVRVQACDTLASRSTGDALGPLNALFAKEREGTVRAAAFDAVMRIDTAQIVEIAEKAVADKAYQVRMLAVEFAPKLTVDLAIKVCMPCIKDPDWRVRSAAIQASREIRNRECLGGLIDQFQKENGRLRWEILGALQDLSGRDLGPDPKPWKTWWNAAKDSFDPPAKCNGAGAVIGSTQSEFFSVPILSTRILFIIDLSGSMRDPAPGKQSLTKLQAAKDGMCCTIKSLDEEVRFGIAGIGSDDDGVYVQREQKTWRKHLLLWPASPANKGDAEKWVKGVEAKGWTNLWDAIEYGFSDADVDTVFLYTDGGVSRGVWVAAGELLSELRRMNRFRRIHINTIEVPGSSANSPDNIKLLRDIAHETGGIYRLAGEKK